MRRAWPRSLLCSRKIADAGERQVEKSSLNRGLSKSPARLRMASMQKRSDPGDGQLRSMTITMPQIVSSVFPTA